MIPSVWTHERLMIPRWRSLAATVQSNELSSTRAALPGNDDGEMPFELTRRIGRWRLYPSLVTAAELVEAALVSGREAEAVEAARRLVTVDESAAPLIRAQAQALLRRVGLSEESPSAPTAAAWRRKTRLHPHDALAWVELAFHQTVMGHAVAAERAMGIALHLAKDNRHVLRSAARLYLHLNDPERAHDLISRSAATKSDPWLLSAEIAFSRAAQRSPRFFKLGLKVVEDGGLLPGQITELAGSVGTLDLLDGSRRRARKMFVRSMEDPNGNALAQAEWATPRLGSEIVQVSRLDSVHEAYEALAIHRHRQFRYSEVPSICERWATVDQYSVRPYEFGSNAAGMAQDFVQAESLASRGLKLRPKSPLLLNYRAFALAQMDRGPDADVMLAKVVPTSSEDPIAILTLANKGLSAFRQGRHEQGISFYRQAIDGFNRIGQARTSAHARVYLAREADRAGLPDAAKLIEEAKKAIAPYTDTNVLEILRPPREREAAAAPDPRSKEEIEREAKLKKLRSVRWTTPGLPSDPKRLIH